MQKIKILVSGMIDLQTIGRQVVGFIGAFLQDERNEIYLDELWFHDKTIEYLEEVWGKELIHKIKNSKILPKDTEYDFMVYPWIFGFSSSPKFVDTLKHRAKIKLCYPVYDGSVPPLEWIDIINKYFDICVCPSDYCAHNLKRYGVKIDCFGLEVLVLIKDFDKMLPQKHEKFRIGCWSASENRKNLPLLIKCFKKAFANNNNVELVIKTMNRNDIFAPIEELKNLVKGVSNIILITDFLSHQEMAELMSSIDVYINPQTTVGFYPSSIEMLAFGVPQIISDIPVHREVEKFITAENNIVFVKHENMGREFHAGFDYRQLGVNFQADEGDYVLAMQDFYKNKDQYINNELVNERKKAARKFIDYTIKKYNVLLHPESIVKSSQARINSTTFYMSSSLIKKYKKIYADLNIVKTQDNYKKMFYKGENNFEFKAIENIAVRDQKIYITNYLHGMDKYLSKIRTISSVENIKVPYFVYKLFKLYTFFKRGNR